jgi:hypothetical protein
VIANPSQNIPSVTGNGTPDANAVGPRVFGPTTGVAGSGTGNASGLTGFENATNPALSGAATTQGRAGGSNGMGNTTSVVSAAPRGLDAGGVAPGAN